jgi:hypothetical protein
MHPPTAIGAESFAQSTFGPGPGAFGGPALTSPGGPSSAPFEAPMNHDGHASPPGGAHYAIAIGAGVLVAALIGVGAFFGLRGRHKAVVEPTPVVVPVPVSVTAAGESSSRVAGGATASAGGRPAVSPELAFRVTPPEATLIVDGKDLAADVHTVPRPAMGMTLTVVARAKGYEDSAVQVDYFTTSPLELTLKPSGAGAAPPTAGAGAAPDPVVKPVSKPAGDDPRSDKDAPKPKRAPPKAEPIPVNPY